MNPIVKQQLQSCRIADIPPFTEDTKTIVINKKSDIFGVSVKEGGCYIIELENYILHPYDGFDLHINWNNNIVPVNKYFKCECIKIMGNMIKINGVGYDYETGADFNTLWSGWLPLSGIKIRGEL